MQFPFGFVASASAAVVGAGGGLPVAATPTINHTSQTVGSQTITVVTNQASGTSFYRIDGGSSFQYTHGIGLPAGSTVEAWTSKAGYSTSATASYTNTNPGA